MKRIYSKKIYWIIAVIFIFGIISCNEENDKQLIEEEPIVSDELPEGIIDGEIESITDYKSLCGNWKLSQISGGIDGIIFSPEEDTFFEIKETSVYSFIKDNNFLYESGKFQLIKNKDALFIEFISEYCANEHFNYFPRKEIFLLGSDSLLLSDPCCDSYCYLYIRVD